MDLNRLKLFLAVAESGSMSAAAQTVHLTQPALSRTVKLLEEELGAPLFERRGRGLVLSNAGRLLASRAGELFELAGQLERDALRAARKKYFDLRLGAIDSIASYLLPDTLERLQQRYPDLPVKLVTGRSAELIGQVKADKLDLAVIASSGPPAGVESCRIERYSLQYYGRRDRFPALAECRSDQEVQRFPIIEVRPPPGAPSLIPEGAMSYVAASSKETAKAMVLAGVGVGDLLDFMLSAEERATLVSAQVSSDPDCAVYVAVSPYWKEEPREKIQKFLAQALRRRLKGRRSGSS